MNKGYSFFSLYKFVLFLSVIESFGAWFFWWLPDLVVPSILFIMSVMLASINPGIFNRRMASWFWIYSIAYLLTIFTQGFPNINGILSIIIKLYPISCIFFLNEECKHESLIYIKKWLAVILSFSLALWILYLLGLPLPHSSISYGEMNDGGYQYYYDNYYFFLSLATKTFSSIPRFYSIFIEPGYLGCLMTILLFCDQYKLGKSNKENIVFLLTLFFTFSLAGWLLCLLGFILTKLVNSKNRAVWLVTIGLLVLGFSIFAQSYKGGDNIFNTYIFSRLILDEATGISGNHRLSMEVQYAFWNNFIKSDSLFWGGTDVGSYSSLYDASNEVTAYAYIMRYGLIAFLFLVWHFFYPSIKAKNNRFEVFSLSLIVFLIFAQTIHLIHSLMYVSVLILGANEIENYRDNKS